METTNQQQKPVFDENAAYTLLLQMIERALENENYHALESVVSVWEQRYDLTNPDILAKVKAIKQRINDYIRQYIDRSLANLIFNQQTEQKNIQQEAYNSFKDIIDNANKTKDYATAEREFSKLKRKLRSQDMFISSFDPYYRKKIYKLLLIPPRALKKQEKATSELKELLSRQDSMTSAEYSSGLISWQNTYCLQDFPKDLQKSLNQLILEVSNGISKKAQAESAILDLKNLMYSNEPVSEPLHAVSSILAKYDNYNKFDAASQGTIEQLIEQYLGIQHLSDDNLSQKYNDQPVSQLKLIDELHYILDVSKDDKAAIISWIYRTRNINFSQFAREEMIRYFTKAGYKLPVQESYSIPVPHLSLNDVTTEKMDSFLQSVIINYLGIMSQGKTLSSSGERNVANIQSTSSKPKNPETIFSIPVEDNYNFSPILLEIEDLLKDPDSTYSFSEQPNSEESITSNTAEITEANASDTVITYSSYEQPVVDEDKTFDTAEIPETNETSEIVITSSYEQPVADEAITFDTVEALGNNVITTIPTENSSASSTSTESTSDTNYAENDPIELNITEDILSAGTDYDLSSHQKDVSEFVPTEMDSTKVDNSISVETSSTENIFEQSMQYNAKYISNEKSFSTTSASTIDNSNKSSTISSDYYNNNYNNLEVTYNLLSLVTTLEVLKSSKASKEKGSTTSKLRT